MGPKEPGANFEIRLLARAEIPELLALWREAGLKVRPQGRERPETLASEVDLYPGNFLGAYLESRLVGAVIATWDGRRGWINRLAVHPEFRRMGLARRLIGAAEADLRTRGAQVIGVLIDPDNTPSLSLFAEAGYLDVPRAVFLSKRDGPDV